MQTKENVSNVHEKNKEETHMKERLRKAFRFVVEKLGKLRSQCPNENTWRTPYDSSTQRALLS